MMDVKKTVVRYQSPVTEVLSAAIAEGIIEVPGNIDKIGRIIWTDAQISGLDALCRDEELSISAVVDFTVVCSTVDNLKVSVSGRSSFSHQMRYPVVDESMVAVIKSECGQAEARITQEGNIAVKAVVELSGNVFQNISVEALLPENSNQIQSRGIRISYGLPPQYLQDSNHIRQDVRLPQGLPPVDAVLSRRCEFFVDDTDISAREILVSGTVRLSVLYRCSDGIRHAAFDLPGQVVIAGENIRPEAACYVQCNVTDVEIKVFEDENQSRTILAVEAEVKARAAVQAKSEESVMSDAYGINARVELEGCEYDMTSGITAFEKKNISYKESADIDCGEAPRLVLQDSGAVIDSVTAGQDAITLCGHVTYSAWDSAGSGCWPGSADFAVEIPAKGITEDSIIDADAFVEALEIAKTVDGSWVLAGQLRVKGYYINVNPARLVTGIEEKEQYTDDSRPLMLAIVQPGDTVWSIAKRCRVAVADLVALNPVLEKDFGPGAAVIAVRK